MWSLSHMCSFPVSVCLSPSLARKIFAGPSLMDWMCVYGWVWRLGVPPAWSRVAFPFPSPPLPFVSKQSVRTKWSYIVNEYVWLALMFSACLFNCQNLSSTNERFLTGEKTCLIIFTIRYDQASSWQQQPTSFTFQVDLEKNIELIRRRKSEWKGYFVSCNVYWSECVEIKR